MKKKILALSCGLFCALSYAQAAHAQRLACPIAAPAPGGPPAVNASRLCVKLTVKNGRVAYDRALSGFTPSPEFTRRLAVTPAQAEDLIFNQLDLLMKTLRPPYRFALTAEERAKDDAGGLGSDVVPATVRDYSGGLLAYAEPFDAWAGSDRRPLFQIIGFNEATAGLDEEAGTGLLVDLTAPADLTALFDYKPGDYAPDEEKITFSVIDPVTDWADPTQATLALLDEPDARKAESRLKQLRARLKPLAGRPRARAEIEARLAGFYRDIGLDPRIIIDNGNTSPLVIRVVQAFRIIAINWDSLAADDANVEKILYTLMSDGDFRTSLRETSRIAPECARARTRGVRQFNYACTGHAGPHLNPTRLQVQQQALNQLGYTLSYVNSGSDSTSSSLTLVVQKTDEVGEVKKETPEEVPSVADETGNIKQQEQEGRRETEFEPGKKKKGEKVRDKKYYVGGGGEYRPGQGVRFFGLGQLSRLPLLPDGVSNVSATGGGQSDGGPLGSINYFGDYLFFNSLGHRRLSVQLTTASDVEADRELTAGTADEERRGGVGRVEFEPFRDRGGSLLRFSAEGRRETVALRAEQSGAVTRRNQTTLDLGALYFFESQEVTSPSWARLEPRFRMGLGVAAGEPRFNKGGLTGRYHRKLPARFELDFAGRAEVADRRTPVFELPSFGGAEVVRGFRRDDAVGRKLWSLQNELWVPLPLEAEAGGLQAVLRQSVRLAPFADFGGLYDPVLGRSGARAGAGLGLRFIFNPIVFKFDYAARFGPAATGGSRGKFHFSIATNLPL